MALIYELDIKQETSLAGLNLEEYSEYQLGVLNAYLVNKSEIDGLISSSLKNWTIDTISKIDLAILRLCVTECLYVKEVAHKIAINEALEIAKMYGEEASYRFVNGLMRVILTRYLG